MLGGETVRCGSDVMIVASAHQGIEDGIVFRRSANNVLLSEGINGLIGPRYFCSALLLRRDPKRRRSVLWEPSYPVWAAGEVKPSDQPETMFTQTDQEAVSTERGDAPFETPDLAAMEGLNPFSDDASESEC